jgi:hypothetical protein
MMTAKEYKAATEYMKDQLENFFDRYDTYGDGESNLTHLGQNAAATLDIWDGEEAPEEMFEIAFEVATEMAA